MRWGTAAAIVLGVHAAAIAFYLVSHQLVRWGTAAAIVLGVHAAAIAFYLVSHQPEEIGDDASAVTIELAPIENTPDAVERDVTPAPETMIESKPLPKPPDNPPPEEKVEQAPPEETPTVIPEQAEQPPEKVEELLHGAARTPAA